MGSRYDQILLLITLLLALWVSSQFGQLTGQGETASVANTYTIMALVVLVVSFSGSGIFKFIGITSSGPKLLITLAAGGLFGFFSTSQGQALIAPILPASIDPTLSATFILLLAPFVEEYFFRGFLFPSISALSGKTGLIADIAGAVGSSILFVIWHLVAYSNTPSAFMSLFIFALLQCALIKMFKELTPAIGSHFILNLLTRR